MGILFKISFLIYVIIQLVLNNAVTMMEIMLILIFLASNIFRVKYFNTLWLVIAEGLILFFALQYNPIFILLYCITAYDLVAMGFYPSIAVILLIGYLNLDIDRMINFVFLLFLSSFFSHISHGLAEKERNLKQSFDKERKARYDLEQTRAKLMASAKEITYLTEIKERNRIARDIHDNVGHSIAGILLQLQAVEKLFCKNSERAMELLGNSVKGLSDALIHLRETVHNIKPKENLGIEYIEETIKQFNYCPVDFSFKGDFSRVPPHHFDLLVTNIKEALTNISKHSKATRAAVNIETNESYLRLYIKDNGVGCNQISENMGLGGMRDRMKNFGGSISINGQEGFLIVCVLPWEGGDFAYEGINS